MLRFEAINNKAKQPANSNRIALHCMHAAHCNQRMHADVDVDVVDVDACAASAYVDVDACVDVDVLYVYVYYVKRLPSYDVYTSIYVILYRLVLISR